MPIYEVTHPRTGQTVEIEGPTPPTSAALDAIFSRMESSGAKPSAQGPSTEDLDRLIAMTSPGRQQVEALKGMAKGVGRTGVGLGRLIQKIPGVSGFTGEITADAEQQLGLDPSNSAQQMGMMLEQLAEFFVPAGAGARAAAWGTAKLAPLAARGGRAAQATARLAPRMATEAGLAAGVTSAQGGDATTAGAVGAALPVAARVGAAVGRKVAGAAVPLVRSAIKPAVTEMKRVAGASATGIDAQANRLARFIIDNRLTTPEKAEAVIKGAERELQALVAAKGATTTDAPQRAMRYLAALERSAAKQGLPAHDVSIIQNAAKELLDEPSTMAETVRRVVKKPSPSGLVDASGRPVEVDVVEKLRQLRPSMPADEALEKGRASSRWKTRKAWGEQKGAATEADKAVERAARDAVKTAIPAAKPVLRRQGQAIQAKKVLDRKAFREANRDAVSLPAHVIAAGEIARGKPPLLAFAANWLRNNQMKAGIWADRLGKAIERKDVKQVSEILGRLGVASTAQATKPAYGSR